MTRIYVFPGQGSQAKGMGKALFDRYPDKVAEADEILGYSVRSLCLDDPDGNLVRTQFTQPALFVVSALSYLARVEEVGEVPEFVAGHSLGEYNALYAAEAFSFGDGVRLVQRRGALMGEATGGGMAAVVGLEIEAIRAILVETGVTGVDVANHNSPTQVVLAGPTDDLDRVAPAFEARKGVRVVPLNVRTAFHSRYMKPTREAFGAFIAGFNVGPLMIPVISNFTALPYRDDEIRHNLVQQIDHPVRWVESVQYLLQETDPAFEEIGHGRVLTRLIADISKVEPPANMARRY